LEKILEKNILPPKVQPLPPKIKNNIIGLKNISAPKNQTTNVKG
jgi:hypothetical protein